MKPTIEAIKLLETLNLKERVISNILPICKSDCGCQKEISQIKKNNIPMKYVECNNPRKKQMKKYLIVSKKSGDEVATVYAIDNTLKDWLDCRYISWHDDKSWHGCLSVQVSPIDESLGFECVDLTDTRDFRVKAIGDSEEIKKRIKNVGHRQFNLADSLYEVTEIKKPSVLKKFKRFININLQTMREYDYARKHL